MKTTIMRKRLLGIILAMLVLNSCTTTASNTDESTVVNSTETSTEEVSASADNTVIEESDDGDYYPEAEYSDFDLDTSIADDAAYVELDGNNAQSTIEMDIGDGYIKITSGGDYVLSGDYIGQIIVESEENVHLIFSGVTISSDMSPVYVKSAKNVCITLASGTVNTISDSTNYVYENDENEPAAAVYSKADLTINGDGELIVNGNYDKGIHSKDDLKIVSGKITVNSVGDAIKGKDCLLIKGGEINVTSDEDALKSNNDTDEEKGYVIIDGGNINISAGDDAVHAESWLIINDGVINVTKCYEGLEGMKVEIYGGDIDIVSSDDTINAASGSSSGFGNFDAKSGDFDFGDFTPDDGQTPPEIPSGEGTDGTVPEKPDGTSGTDGQTPPEIPSGDGTDGTVPEKPDGTSNTDGQTPPEIPSGEGTDGTVPGKPDGTSSTDGQTPPEMPSGDGTDGTIPEKPDGTSNTDGQTPPDMPSGDSTNGTKPEETDDNSDSDTSSSEKKGGRGGGGFGNFGGGGTGLMNEEAEEGVYIKICGGNLTLSGGNDVLDSNGTLEISGGNITIKNKDMVVYGDPDCIIDTNGTVAISGGTFIAFSRGESSASQVVSIPSITASVKENEADVSVIDENGEVVLEIQNGVKCNALYIASDKLTSGSTYTVVCGSSTYELTAK